CGNNNEPLDKHAAIMLLHELLGKAPYIPPEKKEKHLSEARARKTIPQERKSSGDALDRVRRQLRRENINQEPQAGKEKKEKTFIATDENGGMIGVVSAPTPEKAAAKTFHKKLAGQQGATKEKPLEIRIRDLGAGSDYHFRAWTELFEAAENGDPESKEKKAVKKLFIRKMS
ncbi:ATP-dependent helicase, partial [Methanosarcina mazei]